MSAPQAAAITACTACAAVGGAAAGGAFSSSSTSVEETQDSPLPDAPNTEGEDVKKATEEPNWFSVVLEETSNKSTFNTAGKIGKDYEKYLVGAFGTTTNSNEAWWIKSFERYSADKAKTSPAPTFSNEFSEDDKVTKAFDNKDGSTSTALNKVCLKIYGQEKATITPANGDANKAKLQTDLWKYCSPLGEVPKTIEGAQQDTEFSSETAIGKTKKTVLLSTKDSVNLKLWELKNEEFKSLNTEPEGEYFKGLQGKIKEDNSQVTLKSGCAKAYELTTSSDTEAYDTKVKDANVVKYCSLEGK